jgi:hypothetical protein
MTFPGFRFADALAFAAENDLEAEAAETLSIAVHPSVGISAPGAAFIKIHAKANGW